MPPPGRREDLGPLLDEAFEKAEKAVEEVRKKLQECIDNVSEWKVALLIPAPVLLWVKDKLREVGEQVKKLVKLLEYATKHHVPVLSLIYQSFNWIDSVKTPMSELSGPSLQPRDQNLHYWDGAAASAYRTKSTAQQGAINEVVGHAGFISEWLYTIAQTNVDYMIELADFGASMAGELAQAATETATVIDIPWAISTLADQVGALVEQAIKMLIDVGERFVKAVGNVRDLSSRVGDHSKLPGGSWPEAVVG